MPTEEAGMEGGDAPGPHPEPPDDLHERNPAITQSTGPWLRLYPIDLDPVYFATDPSRAGRFGAPKGEYGVLYAAEDELGAFVETFGHDTGIRIIDEADLLGRGLARIETSYAMKQVDLTGDSVARIGAVARLLSGDHGVCRRGSAALRRHPSRPDGIRYPCRHDPSRVVFALYDHISDQMSSRALGTMLSTQNKGPLSEILRAFDFGLTS